MATYSEYTPAGVIAKAMFNFDAFGLTNFTVAGGIRVTVSDSFSYDDYIASGQAFYSGLYTATSNEIAWTEQMIANLQDILAIYSQFADVTFTFAGDVDASPPGTDATPNPLDVGGTGLSDINLSWIYRADGTFAGIAGINVDELLGYTGASGDIYLNQYAPKFAGDYSLELNTRARQTLMHEIGHTLGLAHPHTSYANGVATLAADYRATTGLGFEQLGFRIDGAEDMYREYFTIMSYDDQQSLLPGSTVVFQAHTPMILDVIALQLAYGEGDGTTGAGDDTIPAGTAGYRTYFDKGGNDTLDLALYANGAYLQMGVAIAEAPHLVGVAMSVDDAFGRMLLGGDPLNLRWLYGEFENAIGSANNDFLIGSALANGIRGEAGDDYLDGGAGDDVLAGGEGNDRLTGGAGADQLYGGAGDDTFTVDGQSDLVFEFAGEGDDTVVAEASFQLYAGIENLQLATGAANLFGAGNALDNAITGNDGANLLFGWEGADTIAGGGGHDALYGEAGSDSLLGDSGIDLLVGGAGDDALDGGKDPDALTGEEGDDRLYGGPGFATDILAGGDGSDVLDGSSATREGRNLGDYDLMAGGTGDDTYYVDTPADLTFEDAGGGTDTVVADIVGAGYYLYAQVENLALEGLTPFGAGNDLGNGITGSPLANWLFGGAGDDMLNGRGGGDVLFGEAGADTFVFERGCGGDLVADFQPGVDELKLAGFGIASFEQLAGLMVQVGAFLAIDFDPFTAEPTDFVVLHGVSIAGLSADDFIFG